MSLENFCFVFTYNLLLWRLIVTCNRCNIVSSHKCLSYTNQNFCKMSFNRKLIKFFWGGIFRNWEAMFVLIFAWTSRGFYSSRHTSAQAAHGQFTLGSHLKGTAKKTKTNSRWIVLNYAMWNSLLLYDWYLIPYSVSVSVSVSVIPFPFPDSGFRIPCFSAAVGFVLKYI